MGAAKEDSIEAAFSNELVTERIFLYLALGDLKQCRLVSQKWKFQVESHMKSCNHRQFGPKISVSHPCTDLNALDEFVFVSDLKTLPFINSFTIELSQRFHSKCSSITDSHYKMYGELLGKLKVKHLEISWDPGFKAEHCPAVKFLVTLLREKVGELHTLKFKQLPPTQIQQYFDDDWDWTWKPVCPKLKVLEGGGLREGYQIWKYFMLKILDAAPNLKKLKTDDMDPRTLEIIPEEKYVLLDHFFLHVDSDTDERMCLKLAQAGPALSDLVVGAPPAAERRYMAIFLRVLERLLTTSCKTLTKLTMCSEIFPLCFITCPALTNLRKMGFFTEDTTPQLLYAIRSIDYSTLLPGVAEVSIDTTCDPDPDPENSGITPWVNDGDAAPLSEPLSTSVNKLDLIVDLNLITLKDLSIIFPNVRVLQAMSTTSDMGPMPYSDLWTCWTQVESIFINEELPGWYRNFDAEFLGIFPEEVEILREEDDKSLERMHIVPIRPCISTLSGDKLQSAFP